MTEHVEDDTEDSYEYLISWMNFKRDQVAYVIGTLMLERFGLEERPKTDVLAD